MDLIESIKTLLSKKSEKLSPPKEYCPNCWGRQEYAGDFMEAIHKEHIDLNNVDKKRGWIQAYAAEYLEGIKLKDSQKVLDCDVCKVSYKKKDE